MATNVLMEFDVLPTERLSQADQPGSPVHFLLATVVRKHGLARVVDSLEKRCGALDARAGEVGIDLQRRHVSATLETALGLSDKNADGESLGDLHPWHLAELLVLRPRTDIVWQVSSFKTMMGALLLSAAERLRAVEGQYHEPTDDESDDEMEDAEEDPASSSSPQKEEEDPPVIGDAEKEETPPVFSPVFTAFSEDLRMGLHALFHADDGVPLRSDLALLSESGASAELIELVQALLLLETEGLDQRFFYLSSPKHLTAIVDDWLRDLLGEPPNVFSMPTTEPSVPVDSGPSALDDLDDLR